MYISIPKDTSKFQSVSPNNVTYYIYFNLFGSNKNRKYKKLGESSTIHVQPDVRLYTIGDSNFFGLIN